MSQNQNLTETKFKKIKSNQQLDIFFNLNYTFQVENIIYQKTILLYQTQTQSFTFPFLLMASALLKLRYFCQLIKLKQNVCQIKFKTIQSILSLKYQMKDLKKVEFQFQSIWKLIKQLIAINIKELSTMLILSLIALLLRVFCANFNSFLIDFFQGQKTLLNLFQSIIILIGFKIIKNVIDQWSSYLQMKYGFQGYSALYYHFLQTKKQMTGQILNIIEDDMEKVANLPFSLLNFPFQSILIIVLTIMLALSLNQNVIIVVLLSLILFTINCLSGILIFKLNEKIMKQKDYRLSLNLGNANNDQKVLNARRQQVSMIKHFLMIKVVVKWITEITFVLFYFFIFLQSNNANKNNENLDEDNLYYQLMLLGMLKIPFGSLFMESYYIALVVNSIKRIINCQNRQQIQSSTIGGLQDFLSRNNKTTQKIALQRQSSESQSESVMDRSILAPLIATQNGKEFVEIKQIQHSPLKNKKRSKKYNQKGQIKILDLIKYVQQNASTYFIAGLIIFGILTVFSKFQNLQISTSIIHNSMSSFEVFIFLLPVVLYTVLYLVIVSIFMQVSHNLFKNLNSQQIDGQDLNRISGDIEIVDKYIAPYFYQFIISVIGLLASLAITVYLIKQAYLMILMAFLLLVIIYLSVYFNRYFMKSRRQIKRTECRMKSQIIQIYAQRVFTHASQQIDFAFIEKNWKRINYCKNIGIVIQNSYILILNLLVLLVEIVSLIICRLGSLDSHTTKLILVFVLQIDLTLTGLFLTAINLEMGFVNFQRCLNFVKRKMQLNNLKQQQLRKSNH